MSGSEETGGSGVESMDEARWGVVHTDVVRGRSGSRTEDDVALDFSRLHLAALQAGRAVLGVAVVPRSLSNVEFTTGLDGVARGSAEVFTETYVTFGPRGSIAPEVKRAVPQGQYMPVVEV